MLINQRIYMKSLYAFTLLLIITTVHAADNQEQLLLALPQSNNPKEILDHLKQEGFNINTPIDYYGKTILHHACGYLNNISLAKALIFHNADVNVQSFIYGETPLHEAASIGNLDIVELLLKNGAHSKVKNDVDATPLDIAEIHGHKDIAEFIKNWNYIPDIKEPDTE